MTDVALPGSIEPALKKGPDLDRGFHPLTGVIYAGIVAAALLFVAYSIYVDIDATGTRATTILPYILLFVALLIALAWSRLRPRGKALRKFHPGLIRWTCKRASGHRARRQDTLR